MYQFSQRFKITTFVLMGLGLLGLAYGFLSAPSTVEEAKAIVAAPAADGHGDAHGTTSDHGNA
ncbi:MAG: quinol:cytochrome C oxidoreductase, partial [Flavobacteriaceae bacterium]